MFAEEYETYMKQQDVMYKNEVTTAVVPEPTMVVSQYELEQRRVTTPMSFVSETVRPNQNKRKCSSELSLTTC